MGNTDYETFESVAFKAPGPKNTDRVLEAAAKRALQKGVGKAVVASSTGRTALRARELFPSDVQVVAVTYVTGFNEANVRMLQEETATSLREKGVNIVVAAHSFGGIGRAVRHKTGVYQVDEIMAYTLRILGQGIKVAAEISMMAADAGLVRTDEDIVAIAGSGRGADTAVILQPANTAHFFDMKIKEILCKPGQW